MSELKLTADSGGGTVSLKGPATTTSNAAVPFVLPVADGSAGQFIKTDGSKNLSFSGGGKLLQVVQSVKTDAANSSSIAANTEWDTGLTVTITPSATSSKVLLEGAVSMCGETSHMFIGLRLKSDVGGSQAIISGTAPTSSSNRLTAYVGDAGDWDDEMRNISFKFLDSPSKASAVIYKVYAVHSASSNKILYINRSYSDTDSTGYARFCSSLLATEVAG